VVRLKERDRIDRVHGGVLNLLERLAGGGKLHHCRWCRLQFYDRRQLASEVTASKPSEKRVEVSKTPDTEPAK
jgi:hypothetical protein